MLNRLSDEGAPLFEVDNFEFQAFRDWDPRKRTDCHAAFTTVPGKIIWTFANFGNTESVYKEVNLYGRSWYLDEISQLFLIKVDPNGGRFLITNSGEVFAARDEHASQLLARFEVENVQVE